LAPKAIGVSLVPYTHPSVRVAAVDHGTGNGDDLEGSGHFGARITGGRSQHDGDGPASSRSGGPSQPHGVLVGQVNEFEPAAVALDERADRRAVLRADDDVAFPVPETRLPDPQTPRE
jgi:hypothetical protein